MSSFVAALGGLRANQSWIDVIGNNLANSNTPGFKGSRATFSDLFNITMRPGSAPTGSLGGTNPRQLGLGAMLASVDRSTDQGALTQTGRTFDLALMGAGYFQVDDNSQTLYTRVGTFGLDATGTMVDQRTGYAVLGPNGQRITIDQNAVFPPSATTAVGFAGNLPAEVTGPLAEVLSSSSTLQEGTEAVLTGTASGDFTVPVGETWTMELVVNSGAPQDVSIVGTGTMTAQEIADEINNQTDHVTATVTATQEIVLTSDLSGTQSTVQVNAGTDATKDLKGVLGLVDFVQGTEFAATATTDLSDMTDNLLDYTAGDTIDVNGTDVDGSLVLGQFTYGVDGTTIGDLVAFLDGLYAQSDVTFNSTTGQIAVTAQTTGDAELSLVLSDDASNVGSSDWTSNFFAVTTNGAGPDTVNSSMEVYDSTGDGHVLSFDYTREDDGTWTLTTSVPAAEGAVTSGPITGIMFNPDGSLQTPSSVDITVQFGTLAAQTISLDLGQAGGFEGLTQFGSPSSVVADFQDGYGAGELASLQVDSTGDIAGFYTNGQTQSLGAFGVATFANELGLEALGDNYYRESPNSGQRVVGAGDSSRAGQIIGGAIEASNVDTATEFVNMIQAQRGYQANARVITVQDELLSEAVNMV
jgi:flagellar hook protein FlgE